MIFKITNSEERMAAIRALNECKLPCSVEIKLTGKRSASQNAAAHLAFRTIATTLNEAGLHMNAVLKEGVEVPWTDALVKEMMFKPVALAVTGKDSTTKLTKTEISEAYDIMMRYLSEKFGIFIPWPSDE